MLECQGKNAWGRLNSLPRCEITFPFGPGSFPYVVRPGSQAGNPTSLDSCAWAFATRVLRCLYANSRRAICSTSNKKRPRLSPGSPLQVHLPASGS